MAEDSTKTPQELADEIFQREEARRANQTEFDPKTHGVGTMPQLAPDSVAQLFKLHKDLESRVLALESRLGRGRVQ